MTHLYVVWNFTIQVVQHQSVQQCMEMISIYYIWWNGTLHQCVYHHHMYKTPLFVMELYINGQFNIAEQSICMVGTNCTDFSVSFSLGSIERGSLVSIMQNYKLLMLYLVLRSKSAIYLVMYVFNLMRKNTEIMAGIGKRSYLH